MGVSVIAEAQQSKPSAPLPVPQWIVDDARLVGRSRCEVSMENFVQVNKTSVRRNLNPIGYIIQESGCWEWVGGRSPEGYGRWYVGRERLAHRVMFASQYGSIPKDRVIDHLCRKRDCVNPEHMELVTSKENVLRGNGHTARNARKTHCKRGHSDWKPDRRGSGRYCHTCHKATSLARHYRLRAADHLVRVK